MARNTTLKIDIIADGSRASRAMDNVGGAAGRMGKAMALGVAGAVVAVGKLAWDSVQAASKVQQAFGATEAVFGSHAAQVQDMARNAALAVGLSKSEYADLANVIGSQLRNAGTAVDQLAPKTDKLIGLGADLAAQFGGSTADAVAAVSSLLKGETDPIERYGVSIKQSDINARLAAQGLDKLTGAAGKQAAANAALALLTQQTATAQGAFAREGGTAANSQQKLGAILENVQATIGAYLLPVLAQLAMWLITTVVPAVQQLATKLGPVLQPIISQLSAFITGTAVPALGNLARIIGTQVVPFLAQLGGFITRVVLPPILALATWIYTKLVPALASALGPALVTIRLALANVQAAVERNRPAIDKLGAVFRVLGAIVTDYIIPILGGTLKAAFTVIGLVIGTVIDRVSGLVTWLSRAWDWLGRVADKIRNSGIVQLMSSAGGAIGSILGSSGGALAITSAATAASVPAYTGGGLQAARFTSGPTNVAVYIGEREITDLVRVVVDRSQRAQARRVAAGVRA